MAAAWDTRLFGIAVLMTTGEAEFADCVMTLLPLLHRPVDTRKQIYPQSLLDNDNAQNDI